MSKGRILLSIYPKASQSPAGSRQQHALNTNGKPLTDTYSYSLSHRSSCRIHESLLHGPVDLFVFRKSMEVSVEDSKTAYGILTQAENMECSPFNLRWLKSVILLESPGAGGRVCSHPSVTVWNHPKRWSVCIHLSVASGQSAING
ncbi:hypothetical protein CEXT_172291 [Caerostris extrusa]|uniref:Uncharacterized protein n=1 Tax=Caerostris extrusa TaxID=172846 RepID=A0AAV4MPV7_CAEEX|nr:hypothetical protein CEXT_172291 [Caerostris extrusa]